MTTGKGLCNVGTGRLLHTTTRSTLDPRGGDRSSFVVRWWSGTMGRIGLRFQKRWLGSNVAWQRQHSMQNCKQTNARKEGTDFGMASRQAILKKVTGNVAQAKAMIETLKLPDSCPVMKTSFREHTRPWILKIPDSLPEEMVIKSVDLLSESLRLSKIMEAELEAERSKIGNVNDEEREVVQRVIQSVLQELDKHKLILHRDREKLSSSELATSLATEHLHARNTWWPDLNWLMMSIHLETLKEYERRFELGEFMEGAKYGFHQFYKAFMAGDDSRLGSFCTPHVLQSARSSLQHLKKKNARSELEVFEIERAKIVRVNEEAVNLGFTLVRIYVKFFHRLKVRIVDDKDDTKAFYDYEPHHLVMSTVGFETKLAAYPMTSILSLRPVFPPLRDKQYMMEVFDTIVNDKSKQKMGQSHFDLDWRICSLSINND